MRVARQQYKTLECVGVGGGDGGDLDDDYVAMAMEMMIIVMGDEKKTEPK